MRRHSNGQRKRLQTKPVRQPTVLGTVVNENEFGIAMRQRDELDVHLAARGQVERMRSALPALQTNGLEPSRRRTAFGQRHLDLTDLSTARLGDADPSQAEAAGLFVGMLPYAVDDQPWAF